MGGNWLFGTARTHNFHDKAEREFILVWQVDLDTDYKPRSDNLKVLKVDPGVIGDGGYISGVHPKMDGRNMRIMYRKNDKKFYYVAPDLGGGT